MYALRSKQIIQITTLICVLILLSACSALWHGNHQKRQGNASSLVEYLYPDGRIPPGMAERIPDIKVPMRIGIAFVPAYRSYSYSSTLTEALKHKLLETVKTQFIKRPEIQAIKIIPSHYLVRRGGFNDLRRIAALYGVEQIALVSYDQTGFIHANPLSFTYWTIVGAYVIPGNSHDIQTFVDTAVIDVKTAKLILRAGGRHQLKRASTAVHARTTYRKASQKGYTYAVNNMTTNLNTALDEFKARIRQGSKEAKISYRRGFSGSSDTLFILLALGLVISAARKSTRKNTV